MKYVVFPAGEQTAFLRQAKSHLALTWPAFAAQLGVCRSMIYFYADEHSKLPHHRYTLICQKMGITPEKLPTVLIQNTPKTIYFPLMNAELAEFLGIVAGDGHIGPQTYEVNITLHRFDDLEYSKHVYRLFEHLFHTTPTVIERKNVVIVRVYAKALTEFLTSLSGMPYGRKMGKLRIPLIVRARMEYVASFLRGVFDTDGSFHRHRMRDAMLEYTSHDRRFLSEIRSALATLGVRATASGKNLYVYAKDDIDRFFAVIRPANPKQVERYQFYKQHGYVPKAAHARFIYDTQRHCANAPVV